MVQAREEETERERLRRALYRPGATDADRDRYASVTPEPPMVPVEPAAPPTVRRSRSRRGAVTLGAVVVAGAGLLAWPVIAGTGTVGSTAGGPTASASPAPSASPTGSASSSPAGSEVQLLSITYTDAGVVQAFHGRGPGTAVLQSDLMPDTGGRLSVVLAPSETALIGWQVRRSVPAEGAADQLIASRSVTEVRGVAVPIVFPFDGRPPTTVAVQTPAGVAWSLVVTSLRGATPR